MNRFKVKTVKFTLIELLVVIAILGILTTLLLPSLSDARERTKAAACKSNMRQINIAFVIYGDTNDAAYPVTTSHTWSGYHPISWDDRLSGYDGRDTLSQNNQRQGKLNKSDFDNNYGRVYKCPADDTQRSFGGDLDTIPMSYAVSYYHEGTNQYRGVIGWKNGAYSARMGEIQETSMTILMNEAKDPGRMMGRYWSSHTSPNYINNYFFDKFLHKGIKGSNYLFVDGHVEYLNYYKTIEGGTVNATASTLWDALK